MVYPIEFVSLGPGAAELVTLQAFRALESADIIFCPATVRQSRAATLLAALQIATPQKEFVLPMSNERSGVKAIYDTLAQEAAVLQQAGKRVAVAVEGDAGIYASMHYVLEQLQQAGCPTRQLAGIPSFIAAGAVGQLHLVEQAERFVVLPGEVTAEALEEYLSSHHTVVIMKLSRCADVVRRFMEAHPTYDYHYFQDIATPAECHALNTLPDVVPYFSLMVILGR